MRKGIAWGAAALVMGGAVVVPATSAHAVTGAGLKMCLEDTDGNPIAGQVSADGAQYLTDNVNANGCKDFGSVPVGRYQVRSDAKQADAIPNCNTLYNPPCPHVYKFDHIKINRGAGNPETYSDPTVLTRLFDGDDVKVTFVWK